MVSGGHRHLATRARGHMVRRRDPPVMVIDAAVRRTAVMAVATAAASAAYRLRVGTHVGRMSLTPAPPPSSSSSSGGHRVRLR